MRAAPETRWSPLFSPEEAGPYRRAINAVAEDLARIVPSPGDDRGRALAKAGGSADAPDLAGGKAGPALFFAYRHQHTGDEQDRDRAAILLNAAINAAIARPFAPGLFTGWTGVAWAATHICAMPGWSVDGDPAANVDAALAPLVGPGCWTGGVGLDAGLAGVGTYALERWPRPTAVLCLEDTIQRLTERAMVADRAVTWRTPWKELPPTEALQAPHGLHDLGMTGGAAGIVTLLAEAAALGVKGARPLLNPAVNWLLEQEPVAGTMAIYPSWRTPSGDDGPPSRQGWCRGAPGIAAALMTAAHRTGDRAWRRAAMDLALRSVATPLDQCRIVDHGLCHGAAGVAHVYNRMHQATGDTMLREGARMWFARLLDMRDERSGVGGFQAYMPGTKSKDPWVADAGILTGAAGTALALMAAVGDVEPRWDRMLMASVPPARLPT